MPDISLQKISVGYSQKKGKDVIKDLDAVFLNGKVNAILGESGCGKTTLLKLVAGSLSPNEGRIYFDDLDVTNVSIRDRNVAFVSQNITLYPHMSVFNNIAFPLTHTSSSGDEIKRRVYEVSKLLHIEYLLSRKPKQISLGQAQRAAIAKALIKNPNVILFDEPFSNLDEQLRIELRSELKKILLESKTTALFVTHKVAEAMSIGDMVYVMSEGKIEERIEAQRFMEASSEIAKALIKNEFENENV